jgi:hypothetical protein
MRILDSVEGWLKMTRNSTASAFMYPLLGLNFAVAFSHPPWDFSITMALFAVIFVLFGLSWIVPTVMCWKRLKFWRPRLETYRKRLGGFWEAI